MKSIVIFLLTLVLSFVNCNAQTSVGQKLYNQGLALQKTKTAKSQHQAIAKFKSAKIAFDSATMKSACDDAIAESNRIINTLSSNALKSKGGRKSKVQSKEKKNEVVEPTLLVGCEKLVFECVSRPGEVKVLTNQPEWNVKVVSEINGKDFAVVQKNEDNSGFKVACLDNTGYDKRSVRIEIIAGTLSKQVILEQNGVPVNFSVEETTLKCSKKGGKKSLYVYSNYSNTYVDNNGKNWHVVSKPDWVDVVSADKKTDNFFKKVGNVMAGRSNSPEINRNITTSVADFVILGIPKSSSEYKEGRKDEVLLESGNKQLRILILQN